MIRFPYGAYWQGVKLTTSHMQKSQDDILAEEQAYQEQRNAELQTKIMTTVKQISSMR